MILNNIHTVDLFINSIDRFDNFNDSIKPKSTIGINPGWLTFSNHIERTKKKLKSLDVSARLCFCVTFNNEL